MEQTLDTASPPPSPSMSSTGSSPGSGKTSGHGKQIEEIYIEVTPVGPQPNPPPSVDTHIDCTLQAKGSINGGKVSNNQIELDQSAGPFCIRLKLKDWLEWRQDDPLWVAKDDCPHSAQVDHQQIWLNKNPHDNTIEFLDMNVGDRCTLHFRMNFAGNVHCDPIIDNGGGGKLTRF
jgi:hypothetical protein